MDVILHVCCLLLGRFDLYPYANQVFLGIFTESSCGILIFENLKSHKLIDFSDNCRANTIKIAFTQYLYYSFEGYNSALCM